MFIKPALGKLTLSETQILVGILKRDKKSLALNWLTLLLKQYICTCNWKGIDLSFLEFVQKLKQPIKVEKEGEILCKSYLFSEWKRQMIQPCMATR